MSTTLMPSNAPVLKPVSASASMKPANNVLIPDTNNIVSDVISLTDIAKEELAEQKSEEE